MRLGSLQAKAGSNVKGCSTHNTSSVESTLAKRCVQSHERILIYHIWTVNQANQNDWPKETNKKCLIQVIQTALRAQAWDSLPVCLSTCIILFPLNKYLTCFTTFFVGVLFCKVEGPGPLPVTTGLVARIWCFHCCGPASISGWGTKPCS